EAGHSDPAAEKIEEAAHELESLDSAEPSLVVHRLYVNCDRQLRRPGRGKGRATSRRRDLLTAASAVPADVQRSAHVLPAVLGAGAQRAKQCLSIMKRKRVW